MPAKKRPGVVGVYVELSEQLHAKLVALVESLPLGGKADHIRLALERHVETPPAVAVPALPPATVTPPDPPARKSAAKPRKRKAT